MKNTLQTAKHTTQTETVTGNSIAYRTEDGRLKAADAKENEDLVNLKSQTQAIQTSEERTQNKLPKQKMNSSPILKRSQKSLGGKPHPNTARLFACGYR
ncbi:hypothetical protein [Treponema phagedenis]|uniref:Uncharacterized protein n=1 Tax=Treponema phagedenis TaxID=162 RepID=A0AAF1DBG2_TREPH|nr:hypothetical protein [Treponema phagedenis]QEJ96759.1 hypothetical protein FUT82_01215 [Treponema phagedenis]